MAVQVQASFKKDQRHLDGLDDARKQLIDKPLQPRIIVAVIDVASITHDVLDGSDTPKIRLRQVEVLDGPDAIAAVDLLNRRYGQRTGREDSQATLFDDWAGPAGQLTELDEQAAEAVEALDARRRAAADAAPPLDDPANDPADADADSGEQVEADGAPWPGDATFIAPPDGDGGDQGDGDQGGEQPTSRRRKR